MPGAPGLSSARYAARLGDAAADTARLLAELSDVADDRRGAYFYCCLVLLRHAADPSPLIAEGRWYGRVLRAPRGAGGFGYDPLFLPEGLAVSAAELDDAGKNRLSHRGLALQSLLQRLHEERRHHEILP